MSYTFRTLVKSDYKQFIELMRDFRFCGTISKEEFEEFYDITFHTNIIFVLESNKKLIASVKLLIDKKIFNNFAIYGSIEDVIVKKEYRGEAVGISIINKVVNYCKENNFYKITLTCKENLIPFYEKNNFEVYDIHMSQLLN